MKVVAFFVRHFTERGTEVAIYDYARYNETLLGNRSIVICFTLQKNQSLGWPTTRISMSKFADRFPVIEIDDIRQMAPLIQMYSIDTFYTLTHGMYETVYEFDNKSIWRNCRTVKHCVFETRYPQGTVYCGISDFLNIKYGTNVSVIPHMIALPECKDTLREKLGIPLDAIVIGRHGAMDTFDNVVAHNAIRQFLQEDSNVYFLFMNTEPFHTHPRILYIEGTTDLVEKTTFINTCNAMIHARMHGEIFSIAVGEFSIMNKPVITSPIGDLGHILNLGDAVIIYHSEEDLMNIFKNIQTHISSRGDWNTHTKYTPEYVMKVFREVTGV